MPKMKKYETFDLWLSDQSTQHKRLVGVLRKLVKKTAPKLVESVKWGNGCWVGKEWPVLFVFGGYDILQFGFFGGSSLKDPKGLLEGKGAYVRHIKVKSLKDIDEAAFAKLIRQAIKN